MWTAKQMKADTCGRKARLQKYHFSNESHQNVLEYLTEYWIRFIMLRFSTVFRKLQCPIHINSTSLLYSFSYLAVHSSAEAVRVLCRRGDQPSLRTALQVLCKALLVLLCSFPWDCGYLTKSVVNQQLLFKVAPSGSNEQTFCAAVKRFCFFL